MSDRDRKESGSAAGSMGQTNGEHSESMSDGGSLKAAGIVTIFAMCLLLVAALRFLDVRSDDPPVVAAYATLIYIGLTVFTAVLLIRNGVPIRRLGFTIAIPPWSVIALALLGVAILQLSSSLLTPLWEHSFGSGRDLTRFSDVAGSAARLSDYWRSAGPWPRSARS